MRVNWLAIVVAGVADWLLGAVWFTTFANQWKSGLRMSAEELQEHMAHPNFWPYLVALVCSIVMAYVIARYVAGGQKHGLLRGLSAGVLIGTAACVAMVTEMVFEIRPGYFIFISAVYPLLGSILMGIIIGVWKPRVTADQQRAASA